MFQQGGHYANLDVKQNNYRPKHPIYALYLNGVNGSSVKVNTNASINNLTTITVFIKYTRNNNANNETRILDNNIINVHISDVIYFNHFFSGTNAQWWITKQTMGTFIATYDNTNVANNPVLYYNGISQAITESSTPVGTANTGANDWYIGSTYIPNIYSWTGMIHNLAIFNVILTPTQVSNLSNGSVKPNDISGCVLYHDYTLGHAQDLSGNGNHGTLTGSAQFIIESYLPR